MLRSQLDVACSYKIVAFAPSTVIPAPFAAAELTEPLANVMFKSVTSNVVDCTAVVEPCTVKLPVINVSPPTFKFLAIPTPPATFNAPVVEFVLCVVSVTVAAPVTPKVPLAETLVADNPAKVVAPVTPKVPPTVSLPVTATALNVVSVAVAVETTVASTVVTIEPAVKPSSNTSTLLSSD